MHAQPCQAAAQDISWAVEHMMSMQWEAGVARSQVFPLQAWPRPHSGLEVHAGLCQRRQRASRHGQQQAEPREPWVVLHGCKATKVDFWWAAAGMFLNQVTSASPSL